MELEVVCSDEHSYEVYNIIESFHGHKLMLVIK